MDRWAESVCLCRHAIFRTHCPIPGAGGDASGPSAVLEPAPLRCGRRCSSAGVAEGARREAGGGVQGGEAGRSLDLFEDMARAGVPRDAASYAAAMTACLKARARMHRARGRARTHTWSGR